MSEYKPEVHNMLRYPKSEMLRRSEDFKVLMQSRRTVRHFTSEPVNEKIIRKAIAAVGSAPSGAKLRDGSKRLMARS